jgi:drug/metabolite transporter (DMT)-like permease
MSALSGRRLAMYIGLCAVWGSTWLVIKIGLRDLPPLWFGAIRMALACALLAPFALWRASGGAAHTGRGRWKRVAFSGLLQIGVNYACVFLAEERIDSGLTALLFATFPIFAGIFAHYLLPEEPVTTRTAAAALLGLGGVMVIESPALGNLLSHQTRPMLVGSGLALCASLVAAFANVYNKKYLSDVPPVWNTWLQTLSGSTLLLALAAAFEPGASMRWTPTSVGALLYLSILGTALPFAGLFWLLHRVPVSVIGTIPVVDTVIAVILGHLVLSEPLSPRIIAGSALILVAVLLASRGRGGRAPEAQSAPGRK